MYNVHPYFSLKNLGKKVSIMHGKIWYLTMITPLGNNISISMLPEGLEYKVRPEKVQPLLI